MLCALAPLSAKAIIIFGGNGVDAPANTTAPAGYEDAWNRVGVNGNGTGVYLGNGYVITAAHVSTGGVLEVDGFAHNQYGSSIILENPDSSAADLRIYRVAVPNNSPLHGMDPLAIAPTSLATFTSSLQVDGVLIGTGVGQTTLQPFSTPFGTGFEWDHGGTRDKRWAVAEIGAPNQIGAIGGRTTDEAFTSKFQFKSVPDGSASQHDSGAPLFYDDNGVITLAGLVHSVEQVSYSLQNDLTYFSDLAEYADQFTITSHDLDGDGGVGQSDLELVLNNFGSTVAPAGIFTSGDANGDGLVGIDDLDLILANWGNGYAAPIAAPVGVPEPTSLVLMAGALLALTQRRRR